MLFMPQYAEPWKHACCNRPSTPFVTIRSSRKARAHGMSASIIPMQTEWSGR